MQRLPAPRSAPHPRGSPGRHPYLEPHQQSAQPDPGAGWDPSTRHWLWEDGRCPQPGAGAGTSRQRGWQHTQPLGWGTHPCPAAPSTMVGAAPAWHRAGRALRPREGLRVLKASVSPVLSQLWVRGVTLPGTPLAPRPPPSLSPPRAAGSVCPVTLRPPAAGQVCLPVPALGSPEPPYSLKGWPGRVPASGSPQLCPQLDTLWPARPWAGGPSHTCTGRTGTTQSVQVQTCSSFLGHSVSPCGPQSLLLPHRAGLGVLYKAQETHPHIGAGVRPATLVARMTRWDTAEEGGFAQLQVINQPSAAKFCLQPLWHQALLELHRLLPGRAPGVELHLSIAPPHNPTPAQAPWPSAHPRQWAHGGLAATLLRNGVLLVALPVPTATPGAARAPSVPPAPAPCPNPHCACRYPWPWAASRSQCSCAASWCHVPASQLCRCPCPPQGLLPG